MSCGMSKVDVMILCGLTGLAGLVVGNVTRSEDAQASKEIVDAARRALAEAKPVVTASMLTSDPEMARDVMTNYAQSLPIDWVVVDESVRTHAREFFEALKSFDSLAYRGEQ